MDNALSQAIAALQQKRMVILIDDEDRENEGDLVLAAEFTTAEHVNFLATHARGLICLPLEPSRIDALKLPLMTQDNRSPRRTAFTVSIEAKEGISTGISAFDRARTIQVAVDPRSSAEDLVSPGHVFPLRSQPGGVLVRAGHTEGSLDLMRLANLQPAAVICEIMNEDGTMARLPELREFSRKHQIPIVSIQDVIAHRTQKESLVREIASADFPSRFADTPFRLHAYESLTDGTEHLALVHGPIKNPVLVRMHSECLTGDALGSLRCDCGNQLDLALQALGQASSGILVYMRKHEGRGIGLLNKIRAYALQDQGMDTVEANHHLGFSPDLRHYGLGAQILRSLGVTQLRLLTNNPKKIVGLEGYGLSVVEQVSLQSIPNVHNRNYLNTKRTKLGHLIAETPTVEEKS